MFYAQFVLSKKGPLAKIWLAAHWEKKLSKAQIYETNIQDAVDEIKAPKVKIALRTTGHLLLGIVRIHSKKTKYLLADCNEAFFKIKEAFRTGRIELIEDTYEAPKNAITLPEVYQDIDTALPEFGEFDLNTQLNFNQSRIDDITLKDDFCTDSSTVFNNDFGMDDFGDGAMGGGSGDLAEFGLTDDDLVEAHRDRSQSVVGSFDHQNRSVLREQTPLLMGREAPGQAMFADDDMDHGGMGGDDDMYMDHQMSVGIGGGGDDFPLGASAVAPSEHGNDDNHSIVDAPESSFALEPLEGAAVAEKATRARRKRRLIIDDQKFISGEEMKQNMADYADTLQPLDLAPPTRKLMRLKESGNVEKLFHLPGSALVKNGRLIKQYQSRLGYKSRSSFAMPSGGNNTMLDESIEDIRRDLDYAEHVEDDNMSHQMLQSMGGFDEFDDGAFADIGQPMGFDSPPHAHDAGAGMYDMEEQSMGSGGAMAAAAEESMQPERKKKRGDTSRMDKTADDDDDKAEHGDEDHRWTKRTQNVLNTIAAKIRASDDAEITLSDLLTKGSTRKTAAQKFYTLLVLKKWQAIDVQQAEPYGEIRIQPGPQMEATSAA
ncbi:coh-1 [Pristionchus pacificus]|uniref:Coh-1 n=1 Tax=Pristionchus pacificus TaxID=54126 RepID=A0A2A6C6N1_PRIPA|nr:coh-1 [Pristionchus pacificus]|eukprot:PDM73728.1 coh-1 [Pristionchus pacificus]